MAMAGACYPLRYGALPGIASGEFCCSPGQSGRYGKLPEQLFSRWLYPDHDRGRIWRSGMPASPFKELNHYLEGRIEQLARRHHLLRLSHERLEQTDQPSHHSSGCSRPTDQAAQEHTSRPLPAAQHFWHSWPKSVQFEQAAIFQFSVGGLGDKPVAVAEAPPNVTILTIHSLSALKRLLCHVQNTDIDKRTSSLLLALPLNHQHRRSAWHAAVRRCRSSPSLKRCLANAGRARNLLCRTYRGQGGGWYILELMPDCPADFCL